MNNQKIKNLATNTLILTLTLSLLLTGLSVVNAAEVDTYGYLAVFPNPIEVGQVAVVSMWVEPLQPTAADFFHGFTATITKPDGTTETRGPYTTSAMGGAWFDFVPSAVGNYKFQFSYPGETFSSSGEYYKPVTSQIVELAVQKEPTPSYPTIPLPTDYWDRPINAENREWASIAGNWLMDGYQSTSSIPYDSGSGYNPFSQAPKSSHVVWTKELLLGGLVGGEYGSTSYYTTHDYETHITPPLIINGRLYYRIYENDFRTGIRPGFACADLRTGEELWRNVEGDIDIGQLYDYRSGNQMGVTPWLWDIGANTILGSAHFPHTYKMYDAFTGDLILSFENAIQGGVPVFGSDGAMYIYFIDGTSNWMAMWNSTKAFEANGLIYYSAAGQGFLRPSQPFGYLANLKGTYDWSTGLQWNKTIPDVQDFPDLEYGGTLGQNIISVMGDVLLVTVESFSHSYLEIGYDRNTGERLWIHDTAQWSWSRAFGEGIYADFYSPAMTWAGYDVKTGNKLWQTEPQEYPWGVYGGSNAIIADGKLITMSYDGYVHAFDTATGKQAWKFYSGDTTETPYGHYAFYFGPMAAGGVIFAGTGEHSPTQPLTRGLKMFAINSETGEEVWNITGLMSPSAIADGYLVVHNGYDNKAYVFGKGPSAITVQTPLTAVPVGSGVTITGSITDESAGQKNTPAISDADMSGWMEYLHMQKPIPTNAKGVEITLTAVDPNGQSFALGKTTSDLGGSYGFSWAPTVQGKYQIKASFAGSNSYGSSFATTYLTVGSVSPSPSALKEPSTGLGTGTEVYIGIAAVIVIAVVVAAALLLRKRK